MAKGDKKQVGFKTELTQDRDTKRFLVYKKEDGPIPSLYIAKDAFDGEPPKTITVEVSGA